MICPPIAPITPPEWRAFLASLHAHEALRNQMIIAAMQTTKGPVQ